MKYEFLTNSEEAWIAMLEAISQAQKSIYLEMYILQDDMREFDFINILKNKAKQGVKVKLLLDSFGSMNLTKDNILKLKESGIEVFFISNLLHRAHRKVLIVDESIAFVGGVNLHASARFWNDLLVKIKGRLVKSIIKSFARSYKDAGGKDPSLISEIEDKIIWNNVTAWIVDHSPMKNRFNLKKIYKTHLNEAKNRIILITPYFMPKHWLQIKIHQALLRGVKVEILLPEKTDHFLIDRANYFYMYKLSSLGAKFYLGSKMNHAKVMIIDESECLVGSQNLDFLSFDLNSEIGIFFKDPKVVNKLLEITEAWKKDSILFDGKIYKPRWFDYILSGLIRLLTKNI